MSAIRRAALIAGLLCALALPVDARQGGGGGGRGGGGGGGGKQAGGGGGGKGGGGHHGHGHHGHHSHGGFSSSFFIGGFWDPFFYYPPYYAPYYFAPYYYAPYYPYPYSYPYPVYAPPPPDDSELALEDEPETEADDPLRATYGLVQLRGVPDGSRIELDGRYWLTAERLDDRWLAIAGGIHTIEVKPPDRDSVARSVTVEAGKTQVVRFPPPRRTNR